MCKIIWTVICLFGGAIIVMFQIPVEQAKSNMETWLKLFGFSPDWAQFKNIDRIGTVLGSFMVAIPIILLILDFVQKRKRKSQTTDISSPLKIEVEKDGNAYSYIGDIEGQGIKRGCRQTLSVKIHNIGKKAIKDVAICINEFESLSKDVQESVNLPIYLSCTNTNAESVLFSAGQEMSVNVVSYFRAYANCHLCIEQIGEEKKPEIFISKQTSYKIGIKVVGRGVCSSQQNFEISMTDYDAQGGLLAYHKKIILMKRISEGEQALEERQKSELWIDFNKTSPDYRKEISQKNTNPNTAHIYDLFELTWQISIRNKSAVTIKGVKAKLTVIESDSKKATHLKFADYNDKPYPRTVDISPGDSEFVEVVNWFMAHGKEKEDKLRCDICNIELDHNYTRIHAFFYVGKKDCKIKIEVFADNALPVSKCFNIGIRNNDNTINKICMWEA